MKTIERLRTYKPSAGPWRYEPIYWALRMAEKGGNTHVPEDLPEDAKYPAREDSEYIAAVCNALPALLAVVEAQAAEIAAWREVDVAASAVMKIMRIHGGGALVEEMKEVAMQKKDIVRGTRIATDAALRALEGGE